MMPYFIWKNENSIDNKIVVNKLPPIIKATERVEKIEVKGRHGFLIDSDGTYEGTIKTAECTLMDDTDIDYITAWLKGSGEVTFSNEPDKVYQAYIINQIPLESILSHLHTFIIQFECQPLKLSLYERKKVLTEAGIIMNYGTIEAEPIITVVGSGNITLNINNKSIQLNGIVDNITINSVILDAYKDDILLNNKMQGDFPLLKVGKNNISWTGNATKVEITYRERFI